LGDANAGDNGAVNPLFSADNALAKEMDDKLEDANHANCGHSHDANFGQQQSPINFVTDHHMQCKHTVLMGDEEYTANTLSFQYPQFVKNCTIMNNGHTVQVNIAPSNKCVVSIAGKEFKLVQFHFHTPSEHQLDGKQFDMEMHLVHVNEKNEIAVLGFIFTKKQRYQRPKLELTQSRAHLVLSKMLINTDISMQAVDEETDVDTDEEWEQDASGKQVQKKRTRKPNDFLDQFWSQLPAKKTSKDIMLNTPISFDYLFETSSNNFVKDIESNEINIDMEIFEYMGSLTTPPYTEGVQWLVSKKTHFISKTQLKKLSACWGNANNARDCQDYCGRTVALRSQSSLKVVL
jgi:carbonic anhydrase